MLEDAAWARDEVSRGLGVPTYSYALNNPIRNTDPDGLQVPNPGMNYSPGPPTTGPTPMLPLIPSSAFQDPNSGAGAKYSDGSVWIYWIDRCMRVIEPEYGQCMATGPTPEERLRECERLCRARGRASIQEMFDFCDSLPAENDNQRRVRAQCFEAANKKQLNQKQECLNMCNRAFGWSFL